MRVGWNLSFPAGLEQSTASLAGPGGWLDPAGKTLGLRLAGINKGAQVK